METGLISNVAQIYSYINELKRVKKELVINCYFDINELEPLVKQQKLIYEYKEKCYLNLLYEENEFFRLYFFVADIETFDIEKNGVVVICDLFTTRENEQFNRIKDRLCECNFSQYACIQKWKAKCPRPLFESDLQEYIFGYDQEPEAIKMIFDIFDKYTDYLPRECEINTFLAEKKFINVYEKEDHRFLGSLIYSQRKNEFTMDFYFTKPEERGKRISYLLHDHYYQKFSEEGRVFVSWIHIKNEKSIMIHQRYQYQKMNLKKYTFIKRGDKNYT